MYWKMWIFQIPQEYVRGSSNLLVANMSWMVEFKIHVFMHHYSTNLNLVIKSIPLRLWQLKTEFEDGLINLKNTIFKSRKVLEFLIFKSKLFISMAGDGKKEFIKKLCLPLKRGSSYY